MLFPPLLVPPKSGRTDTWYCVLDLALAPLCARAGVSVAPQQTAASTMTRVLVVVFVVMFVSFVELS
jgi:hypothetical protein